MNEPIPVLDLQYIVNNSIAEWGEAWKKLFWAHPATLIDKDIYPLDLAEIAGNEGILRTCRRQLLGNLQGILGLAYEVPARGLRDFL